MRIARVHECDSTLDGRDYGDEEQPIAEAHNPAVGNRLTKTTGAATDTFDSNGSTTDDGEKQLAYDTRGRMVSAIAAQGTTTYQINALGQRIRKTNGNEDRIFVYDTRGQLIAEADPGGTVRREYLYLGDIPVGVVQ